MSVTGVVGGRGKQQAVKSTVGETEPRRKGWSFELERNASPGGNTHGVFRRQWRQLRELANANAEGRNWITTMG